MPEETGQHEGTWLQWPHDYTYGAGYRDDVESTWIEMTRGLVTGENVHIIAYNNQEELHIIQVLTNANVPLTRIDFYIYPTDDFWVRDNGPIFVYDNESNQLITDWGFNGWGNRYPYENCDIIPELVSEDIGIPRVDLSAVVLEGGSIEVDGNGTLMATRSSIINNNRNPDLSQSQIEEYLTIYLGISHFIWLDGVPNLDITDFHIDGFARFYDSSTIVCLDEAGLVDWGTPDSDIDILLSAQNIEGNDYDFVFLPLTQNNVVTAYGQNLGYKGSYVNYYIGNSVVLVPHYSDPNDDVVISILENLYPNRTVVGVDVRNMYAGGGMIHCVTQQQPIDLTSIGTEGNLDNIFLFQLRQNYPNPFNLNATIPYSLTKASTVTIKIYNASGQLVKTLVDGNVSAGQHEAVWDGTDNAAQTVSSGIYFYKMKAEGFRRIKWMTLIK